MKGRERGTGPLGCTWEPGAAPMQHYFLECVSLYYKLCLASSSLFRFYSCNWVFTIRYCGFWCVFSCQNAGALVFDFGSISCLILDAGKQSIMKEKEQGNSPKARILEGNGRNQVQNRIQNGIHENFRLVR
ncbi:hypothetical protein LXL04_029711 [Taraxacum kok-saghyz]